MAAGCQVRNWRAFSGLDNQLTLIKLPRIELLAMIFHTGFGSVVSRLQPLGIELWPSDSVSNPRPWPVQGSYLVTLLVKNRGSSVHTLGFACRTREPGVGGHGDSRAQPLRCKLGVVQTKQGEWATCFSVFLSPSHCAGNVMKRGTRGLHSSATPGFLVPFAPEDIIRTLRWFIPPDSSTAQTRLKILPNASMEGVPACPEQASYPLLLSSQKTIWK